MLEECVICLEPFAEGEDYVTPLACDKRHLFHSDCIEEWLKSENFCPMCKKVQTPRMMRAFSEQFNADYEMLQDVGNLQEHHTADLTSYH